MNGTRFWLGTRSGCSDWAELALTGLSQLRQPRLAEMIAAKLRDEILSGVHPDGGALPRQEDLIARFRVSPPSLREALRILETEGLVTVQRGKIGGAIVHTPRAGKVAYMLGLVLQHRSVTLADIADTLSRLDPECARRCAERPDRRRTVVPVLRANLAESKQLIEDAEQYAALARAFHELLVANCGSETMSLLVGTLESLWSAHVADLARPAPTTTAAARRASWAEHEELVALIESGDVDLVESRARAHLTARDDLAYPFSVETPVRADMVRDA
jgi:DNA-binding FadR family transcriptional regulator